MHFATVCKEKDIAPFAVGAPARGDHDFHSIGDSWREDAASWTVRHLDLLADDGGISKEHGARLPCRHAAQTRYHATVYGNQNEKQIEEQANPVILRALPTELPPPFGEGTWTRTRDLALDMRSNRVLHRRSANLVAGEGFEPSTFRL